MTESKRYRWYLNKGDLLCGTAYFQAHFAVGEIGGWRS